MKRLFFLLVLLVITVISCTTTQLIDNWKNPDIDRYEPQKVLIVGLTSNIEARQKFEKQLKDELELRGSEAVGSLTLFDPSFRTEKMTEEELKALEDKLIDDGFDTILFTKIIGVEDKVAYKENYHNYDETYRKFTDEYLRYQDIYYNPEYYDQYTIYHSETSMYCICPTKDRELIWKGYIDIVDPTSIDESVDDYVKLAIAVLEEQQLINQRTIIPVKKELID
ncbi:hypothetical protein H2O64_20390 [Kordia sp. YSTF-M3]|uniref:Cardiolipin synthetase n=1 Tax=Kordia aestuariivivens TaxID=2759037 RepID=A0ABR7QF46_9FLAO|nr:hypothetical protein [Kordia aestuariivivens]MBC8757043.1 hypothetical protein [Kordia aestuariivivens]